MLLMSGLHSYGSRIVSVLLNVVCRSRFGSSVRVVPYVDRPICDGPIPGSSPFGGADGRSVVPPDTGKVIPTVEQITAVNVGP